MTSFRRVVPAIALVIFAFGATHPASADPDDLFPVLFTTPEALAEFGIEVQGTGVIDDQGGIPAFPNKCYDLNTGSFGYRPISISDDILDQYRKKGFTLETLCIALVSQARFNPETGERLPTYVLRDDANIDQALDADAEFLVKDELIVPGIFPDAQAVLDGISAFKARNYDALNERQTEALVKNYSLMTWEQPLAVPTCFKNGTPYLDCEWRFGMRGGKPFSATSTKRIRDTGIALDKHLKAQINSGNPFGYEEGPQAEPGYLSRKGSIRAFVETLDGSVPPGLRNLKTLLDKDTDLTWYDVSPNLPRGYALAFFAQQNPDQAYSPGGSDNKKIINKLSKPNILKALKKYASPE